tara:strand:+ start:1328 stop:1549 length:222 start_codon:yes stop_codon:yes gene_type:complete
MGKHITDVCCDYPKCNSNNATVIIGGSKYCADHAYYLQTGEYLTLVLKNKEPEETEWKWERKENYEEEKRNRY